MSRSQTSMKTAKLEATESVESARRAVAAGVESIRSRTREVERGALGRVETIRDGAVEKVGKLKNDARHRYESSAARVREGYAHGQEAVRSAANQSVDFAREHPGAMALASFGAGLLLGVLIPRGRARRALDEE